MEGEEGPLAVPNGIWVTIPSPSLRPTFFSGGEKEGNRGRGKGTLCSSFYYAVGRDPPALLSSSAQVNLGGLEPKKDTREKFSPPGGKKMLQKSKARRKHFFFKKTAFLLE